MPRIPQEDEDGRVAPEEGRTENVAETAAPTPPVACLWVPDPETRRGWREYWVSRDKPGQRRVGFGRR
jgi:hypothetical protein